MSKLLMAICGFAVLGFAALQLNHMSGTASKEFEWETISIDPEQVSEKYSQISDPVAPTLADLKGRGLVVTDQDSLIYACDPISTCMHTFAIFVGNSSEAPASVAGLRGERKFVCPNPGSEPDREKWLCAEYEAEITNG